MNVISIINSKGGVGKTVTAVHLGACLAQAGWRTLLIDVDLQHGLSNYFQIEADDLDLPSTASVLLDGAALADAAIETHPDLAVVPATAAMERAEVELAAAPGGEVRLRRAVKGLTGYDYVLIDCPSGWGAVTRNALLASSAMIVPVNSEPAAIACALSTDAGARELGEYHDHAVGLLGVLITRWRSTNAARAVAAVVTREWGPAVFTTRIRQAEKINELTIGGETMLDVSRAAAGGVGDDYAALAREVIARCPPTDRSATDQRVKSPVKAPRSTVTKPRPLAPRLKATPKARRQAVASTS